MLETIIIGDVYSRHKFYKIQCFTSTWADSLGMLVENAARENNLDPKVWTENNIFAMKSVKAIYRLGKETCSENYQHQQNFFLEMYNKGLVYRNLIFSVEQLLLISTPTVDYLFIC